MLRLDVALAERGLSPSRQKAKALIEAGAVTLNGQIVQKASAAVTEEDILSVLETPRFVSRAGDKLRHALDIFEIDPTGLTALDVGASTGGFTDCLLQCGAAKVYAVDVGHGQLAPSLAQDSRVVSQEGLNARILTPELLGESVPLAVMDVSFISQKLVLPAVAGCLLPGGVLITLVKPQFEAGRADIGKGGIVRDQKVHERVLQEIAEFGAALGLTLLGRTDSPISGGDGNREFLMCWRKSVDS